MKRWWVLLLALGLALAMAAPAGAVKPDCEVDDSHPSCKPDEDPEPPQAGTICDLSPIDNRALDSDNGSFTFSLTGDRQEWCVDVTNVNLGSWDILIDPDGNLIVQTIVLRDAVGPGDVCSELHPNKVKQAQMYMLDGIDYLPNPYNGCAGDQFGEQFADHDPAFAFLLFGRGTGTVTVTYPVLVAGP